MRILSTSAVPGDDVEHHRMSSGGRSLRARVAAWLARAEDADAVVLVGSVSLRHRYDQLVAARIYAKRHPRRPVVLADCTWDPGSRAVDRLLRSPRALAVDDAARHLRRTTRWAIGRLRLDNVHCCVLSSAEAKELPDFWGIAESNVHVTGYWASNLDQLRRARQAVLQEAGGDAGSLRASWARPFVFAGGDSVRDYRPLLAAAPQIRGTVRIATRLPLPDDLPDNVVAGPVPPAEFLRLAVTAPVVVVPLVATAQRSAGQKTYLGAMGLGQTLVVPDAPGVLDHVRPGATGLVPPAGDVDALAAAVDTALHDESLRHRLGAAARADVDERFSAAAYGERLYGLARRLVETGARV